MLSRGLRLRKDQDFLRVYRKGRKFKSPHLQLFYLPRRDSSIFTTQNLSRFGFVVSKKHVKEIARRNRVKRILRAETQKLLSGFPKGADLIFQTQTGVEKLPTRVLREEFLQLFFKLKTNA